VFEEVRVGGVPKPVHAPLVLGPEPRELDVSYTAPELLAPQRLTFERRLWPLEAAWSSPGAARRALLAGLRPGRYELQVRARVAGGPPSHPSTLSILVRPHVYETVWFYAVVVAALAAAALLAHRLRVRVLAARYQAVQDERLRIARDLHDGLAQGFTAIGFHVDSVRLNDEALAPRSREVLDRTRSLVDAVQTQVRSSIAQLRERGTGAVSLVAWLERVRDEIRLLGPVEVALVVRGEVPLVGAGAAHELAMIAREAGTNAVRHGHAKRVTIGLELAEGDAVLGVDDDGSGFDAAAANRGGFGVQGMRERAARLGGSVVIGRGAGGGTSVVARVPRAALAR
jgi:signal transduction histidine kinase